MLIFGKNLMERVIEQIGVRRHSTSLMNQSGRKISNFNNFIEEQKLKQLRMQ